MEHILVGMSGGVDSSVAALILQRQGCAVTGVTLRLRGGRLAASTGAAGKELEGLRDVMEDVYAANYGDSVADVGDAVAMVNRNMANLDQNGLTAATEGALALRDGILPPTLGYKVPDEDCDLDYIPEGARHVQAEYALSNALGFGGHNACLLLKRYEG